MMTHRPTHPLHLSNCHRQRELQCPKIGEQQPRQNNEIRVRQTLCDFQSKYTTFISNSLFVFLISLEKSVSEVSTHGIYIQQWLSACMQHWHMHRFFFLFFLFFSFPIPFVYLFLQVVHSFYSTYTTTTTTTTGDYCKMTYLSNVKGFSGVDDTTKNLNLKVR